MDRVLLGVLCGLGFGLVTVLIVLFGSVHWESPRQKQEGAVAAFISRFVIGLLIPLTNLGIAPVLNGVVLSLAISLPPAILSRRYAPILISALIGGAIIGWIAGPAK